MHVPVLLALVGCVYAAPNTVQRIVGGSLTTIESYPYMANMQFGWMGSWFRPTCGGSVLTNDIILTAAHCCIRDDPISWRALLGTSYRTSLDGASVHFVSEIITHPDYRQPTRYNNDVALMRLTQPAVFSKTIGAARIPSRNYVLPDGTSLTAIGWGSTASGGSSSEQLRHVDYNVINQELCAARHAYLHSQPGWDQWPLVTEGMICTGILDIGGKDSCQGDSGGPVAHLGDIVVGITSWGFGCGDPFYPGVNARVSHYTDWIVENA